MYNIRLFHMKQQRQNFQHWKTWQAMEEIAKKASFPVCMVIMDYEMEFNAIFFRENAGQHFGQRGMRWNESVVFFEAVKRARRKMRVMESSKKFYQFII